MKIMGEIANTHIVIITFFLRKGILYYIGKQYIPAIL